MIKFLGKEIISGFVIFNFETELNGMLTEAFVISMDLIQGINILQIV